MDLVALHLAQELVGFLRLRDEEHRADELSDVEVPLAAREALEQILHIDHADDLIERALVDRQPRMAVVLDLLEHLRGRRVHLERDDVGARDHDLAHVLLAKLEDR